MKNRVELNLPEVGSAKPPIPEKAAVIINDVPLHAVKDVRVAASQDSFTEITVTFYAEVTGPQAT